MSAERHNILIEQGTTFGLEVAYEQPEGTPVDITGWSARMQVRQTHASTSSVLDLTSLAGSISVDGPRGTVTVNVGATQTAALPAPFLGVYDLEIASPGGTVIRLVEGSCRITPEVTR